MSRAMSRAAASRFPATSTLRRLSHFTPDISMHHPLRSLIRHHQQLPFDVLQHLSDHWGTIFKTKSDSLGFGFSMMLSFDHPSKNLDEGTAEKIQSSFGERLKVEATMVQINSIFAIMLTTLAALRIWTRKLTHAKSTINPMDQQRHERDRSTFPPLQSQHHQEAWNAISQLR